jgi:hypothetical protein
MFADGVTPEYPGGIVFDAGNLFHPVQKVWINVRQDQE